MNATETIREIAFNTDMRNRDTTFSLEFSGFSRVRTLKCVMRLGYQAKDDGIFWALQKSICIQSSYTDEEIAERQRLRLEEPVRDGDIVRINGGLYKTRILGDYTDAAIFDPIAE